MQTASRSNVQTAAQFTLMCDAVGWACSSLAGCTLNERAYELARLQSDVAELAGATLLRANPRLEERRADKLISATALIIRVTTIPVNETK